ncbi:hypothetical protein [Hyphococcus lacteus]|uniref:Uncharacterized protein n=1 Tax=Hyphococcus lacteus TaxID=3143536 RepID=A0ABV3Z3E4_9PROT
MPKYSYQLIIPPEVKINRRDVNSIKPVVVSRETHEEFAEIEKAESRAIELINDSVIRIPNLFQIVRVPDGVTLRKYSDLKALAIRAKEKK